MRPTSRLVLFTFAIPALVCSHYAYALARGGHAGWGWFLLISLTFWGVVLNTMTDHADDLHHGKVNVHEDEI